MGRNSMDFPENYLFKIEDLASKGLRKEVIANSLGFSLSTFERREKDDEAISFAFKKGRAKAIEEVSSVALEMALSGKHPNMTMFWLKVHAGWENEKDQEDDSEAKVIKFCYQIPGNRFS